MGSIKNIADSLHGSKKPEKKITFFSSAIKKRWLLNNFSVIVLAIVFVLLSVAIAITTYHYDSLKSSLTSRANTVSGYINRYMTSNYNQFYTFTGEFVENFSEKDKVEIQIVDVYGRVMFSSTGFMAGYVPSTPDVGNALSNAKIWDYVGMDPVSGERIAAVTAPIFNQNGSTIGGVRFVSSTSLVEKQLIRIYLLIAGCGIGVIGKIIISTQFFISSIVNPVIEINELAKKIAKGQYGEKINMEFNDEIGELCNTINNMSVEIARVEKVKNDFISSVSHELRTPLTAIGGWTETIAVDFSDKETMSQGLNIIHKETMRLTQMVEELLDFSRIESGRFKLQMEIFDIRGELYDAVFIYRTALMEEGMAIEYDEGEEPIIINGDKHRIKQVFLNIIDNAAKYGADGNKIEIKISHDDSYGLVTISDFGQGIPEEELPFVKQKFFKGSSKQRGAGIGLAVCNEIVTLHGGELDIQSVYGEGTTVSIYLPLYREETGLQ